MTQLIERYGSMSMSEVLQPAIDYAENGFPVSPQIGKSWSKSVRMLSYCENARQTYLTNGRSPKIGEVFQIKTLARTLQLLAEGGRRAFYEGEIAQQIVQYSNRNNGWLSMKDFQIIRRNGLNLSVPIMGDTKSTSYLPMDKVLLF